MVRKLTIVSIVLIVLNVVLLSLIFTHRNRQRDPRRQRPARENFDRRLAERLAFSEEQLSAYRTHTQQHRQRHQELSIELLGIKENIHSALAAGDEAQINDLLPQMDSVHSLREREVVRYAQSILTLCDERQKEEFLRLLRTSIEGRRGFHRGRN